MIGTIIGNYRIVRELGQGGMGAVYEGIDVMVERPVAVKMLRPEIARNPDVIERFRVEAVTLARLNHPSVATLYSFFREGEHYYMVMEFVRGDTMENLMRRSGRLAPEHAADILAQTLDGMAHAHAMGVLHRDIKPANIMITNEGRVKVTDFGIARVLGSSRMTRDGRIIGTLEYLAPERIRGEEADIRSDLYSVGIVFYEAISGRLPFTADTDYDLMQAHLNQAPPSLPSLGLNFPPWINPVLERALAKSREERFRSAEEFRDTLAAAVPHPVTPVGTTAVGASAGLKPTVWATPSLTASTSQPTAISPPSKRIPLKPLAFAGGALVVLIGLFLVFHSRPSPPMEPTPAVVTSPQPVQTIPPPLPNAEPQQQAKPADTAGNTLPLEIFQNKPASDLPNEAVKIGSKDRGIKTGIPKNVDAPGRIVKAEPPKEIEVPRAGSLPGDRAANEPTRIADPTPSPKAEPTAPAPAYAGAKTLQEVRKIFVEKMPNQLDEYIKTEIEKQLWGRVRLVARKEEADAVLRGDVIENPASTRSKITGGYLGMKDENIGSATLTDLRGKTVLWNTEVGDKSPILGIVKRGGPKKIAERLVNNLKKKMDF